MPNNKSMYFAYPSEQGHTPDGTWNQTYQPGTTERLMIASMALQGLLASCAHLDPLSSTGREALTTGALEYADMLIAKCGCDD